MLILESLWQPSGKDVLGRVNPIAVRRERNVSFAATTFNMDFDDLADNDQVFLLHHFTYQAAPESPITTISQLIVVVEIKSNLRVHAVFQDGIVGAAGVPFRANGLGNGPLSILFGGDRLRFNTVMSAAGTGGNNLDVTFFGVTMPRGNWQRE